MTQGVVLIGYALSPLWLRCFGIGERLALWWAMLIGFASIGVAVFVLRSEKVRGVHFGLFRGCEGPARGNPCFSV